VSESKYYRNLNFQDCLGKQSSKFSKYNFSVHFKKETTPKCLYMNLPCCCSFDGIRGCSVVRGGCFHV
jgi:hypothetical protein